MIYLSFCLIYRNLLISWLVWQMLKLKIWLITLVSLATITKRFVWWKERLCYILLWDVYNSMRLLSKPEGNGNKLWIMRVRMTQVGPTLTCLAHSLQWKQKGVSVCGEKGVRGSWGEKLVYSTRIMRLLLVLELQLNHVYQNKIALGYV